MQTQVLPYLREIMKAGVEFELLTFEPAGQDETQFERFRQELAAEGIDWHWLRYHKRLSVLATAYDILCGTFFTWRRIGKGDIDIVHSRVHVPQLMASVARKFSRKMPKLLFDIRGFMPEEYTDAGRWPENGWLYRSAKRIEKWLMRDADGFVVLTEKAQEILFPESIKTGLDKIGRPVELIPCCVDLDRFAALDAAARISRRNELRINDRKVVAYVGSFGGWYMTDEMINFFSASRKQDPTTFALILTQRETAKIEKRLLDVGFSPEDFLVESVPPNDIADYLSTADVAVSFINACYSKLSSSPTKIAEYLACGVPIITNRGVGDVAELIEANGVGVVIDGFRYDNYVAALQRIETMGTLGDICRATSKKEFDLHQIAGNRYRALYKELSSS